MRISLDDYRTLNHSLPTLTGGLVAKGYAYEPGDGSRRYVGAGQSWNGRNGGAWFACAYYAGQILGYSQATGSKIPAEISDLIAKVRTNVPASRRVMADQWEAHGRADILARIEVHRIRKVTNDQGVTFNLVYVPSSPFAYPAGGPVVEVFDTRYDHTEHGQFVSRIGAVGDDLPDLARHGWDMVGYEADWKLSAANVREMIALIDSQPNYS